MVRRHRARVRHALEVGGIDVIEDRVIAAEFEHPAGPVAVALARQRVQAAQHRGDVRRLGHVLRQAGAHCEDIAAALLEPFLGHGDELDHPVVGGLRVVGEGEDAVLQHHHALDIRVLVEDLLGLLGQPEARHDVGHQRHPVAVEFAQDLRAVIRLVGQREHRVGMGMVDELVRQEGMQQRFHRRVRRLRIQQVAALGVDHVLVRE